MISNQKKRVLSNSNCWLSIIEDDSSIDLRFLWKWSLFMLSPLESKLFNRRKSLHSGLLFIPLYVAEVSWSIWFLLQGDKVFGGLELILKWSLPHEWSIFSISAEDRDVSVLFKEESPRSFVCNGECGRADESDGIIFLSSEETTWECNGSWDSSEHSCWSMISKGSWNRLEDSDRKFSADSSGKAGFVNDSSIGEQSDFLCTESNMGAWNEFGCFDVGLVRTKRCVDILVDIVVTAVLVILKMLVVLSV